MVTLHDIETPRIAEAWNCPNYGCGWTRTYVIRPVEKANQVIDHPFWGMVTVYQAAQLDIVNHNCIEHRKAQTRARGRQQFAVKLRRELARSNLSILPAQS